MLDALRARNAQRQGPEVDWLPLLPPSASIKTPPNSADTLVVLINATLDDIVPWLHHPRLVDLAAYGDPPLASQHGWIIGAGGARAAVDAATALLDALAPPRPQAWLHLGPSGAGAFAAGLVQHWQSQTLAILGWLGGTDRSQWVYDPGHWQALTQVTLAQAREDATRYLAMAATTPFEPARPTPAALTRSFPFLHDDTAAPATLLAQLVLSIPALPQQQ
ncbi:hypothetical protein [Jeongeupia sp. USM3]|uniref:hypothetical protein n=1 Tax=Jeongeupia sp. USM3 TaxID=1906741 RepID=UPI00089DEAF4|nr:hypothetical protein [Jeongeupia sp. USM3]AOX99172.1 hypothetical protein BJP62_01100 [Jeongeupia sp. USM3]